MIGLPPDVTLELDAAAQRHAVARELARAVAWVESRGQQDAQSARGAIGVMQLMPRTAQSLCVDPRDRAQNIEGGVRLLRRFLDKFEGDERRAIAAYVWGPAHVQDKPSAQDWPEDVRRYVLNVVDRKGYEQGLLATAQTLDLPTSGIRSFGFQRSTHKHNGIDLRARAGDSVYAAAAGVVEHANREWVQGFTGYGRNVVIRSDDGKRQLYGHLESVFAKAGERVNAGELIGQAGRTEFSRDDHESLLPPGDDHTHFEVAQNAYPMAREAPRLDPVAWLAGKVHPIARVIVGGNGAPSPFVPTPAPIPLPRSFSRLELLPRASRLRAAFDRFAEALALEPAASAFPAGLQAMRENLRMEVGELCSAIEGDDHT